MRSILLIVILCASFRNGHAQDLNASLVRLNQLFAGRVEFTVDKDNRLITDHFESGKRVRQDVVYLEFLDPNAISFSAEENAIVLQCSDDHAQCIDKEVYKLNMVRHTGRSTLSWPEDAPEPAMAVLAETITEGHAHIAEQVNETHSRPSRKK